MIPISSSTTIFCILGNPVQHSLSPAMHNAAYKAANLDYAYVAFNPSSLAHAIAGIRALGIRGASITIPFKQDVVQYLDEIDMTAKNIGAVNTIINTGEKLIGYNTDMYGAMTALSEKMPLAHKKVAVIGSGGAARAIVVGLLHEHATVTIYTRNLKKTHHNFSENKFCNVAFQQINPTAIQQSDCVINTTPLGMHPFENESPVPSSIFKKNHVVFDIVYTPKKTKFLTDARAAGATIVHGHTMLLYQAVKQFELFTVRSAPIEVMKKTMNFYL